MELLIINCSRKKSQGQAKKGGSPGAPATCLWAGVPPPEVLCLDPWSKIAGFGAAKCITPRAEGPWWWLSEEEVRRGLTRLQREMRRASRLPPLHLARLLLPDITLGCHPLRAPLFPGIFHAAKVKTLAHTKPAMWAESCRQHFPMGSQGKSSSS